MKIKKLRLLGAIIGLSAFILAWIFYGWQLSLIIFLALLGNNIEQNSNERL